MYADWLSEQSDPRGELIAIQHARETNPNSPALAAGEAKLLLDRRVSPFASSTGRAVEWRRGFIRSARIHDTSGLARLLRHPATCFLRNLWLQGDNTLVEMLRDGPDLPLRQLALIELYAERVTIDLGRKFPKLEHLEVTGQAPFEALALPALRRLYLRTRKLEMSTARAIVTTMYPHLEEIELRFDESAGPMMFVELFERSDLPALRVARFADGNWQMPDLLARAPFAPQLETIDLFDTFIGPTAAQRLIASRERFTSLHTLIVNPRHANPSLQEAFGERLRTEKVARPFSQWRQ